MDRKKHSDVFHFRQFSIQQDMCAMKVGTDGTLLGAWAQGGYSVLDIGTGTGLIALMMAQRYPQASITAVDIDGDACLQARQNALLSPFAHRIQVVHAPVQQLGERFFHAIVSNPPFFVDALKSPDPRRACARHAHSLTPQQLMQAVKRLLAPDGEFSLVVPAESRTLFDTEAVVARLFPARICAVSTNTGKPPKRFLLAYRRQPSQVQTSHLVIGSEQYRQLTNDFYLPK